MIIDSHCHLNLFPSQDVDAIVSDCDRDGVGLLLTVCTSLGEVPALCAIVNRHPSVYMSLGVHPSDATGDLAAETLIERFRSCDKAIALGETGLDCYRDSSGIELQKRDFSAHVEASRVLKVPVIIHSRNADQHISEFLRLEMKKGAFTGVMHSFASSKKLCEAALDLGLYISFSGIVTFKNAESVREVAAFVPSDRILVETDAPYLAPEPLRGSRNHPRNVVRVLEFLKTFRKEPDLEQRVDSNFHQLFGACGGN